MPVLRSTALFTRLLTICPRQAPPCFRAAARYKPGMGEPDGQALLCHRCGAELVGGRDQFYHVRITAVADPTPPHIDEADLQADLEKEIQDLLNELRGLGERELANQVFRRLTIQLCARCYAQWIENPAG